MKINRTLLKIAILFVAINDAGSGATNTAVPLFMAAMPQVAPSLIQLIVTLPALFIALTPIVYAKLVDVMSKRSLLWIGTLCFIVGGVAPAFLTDIWAILFFRALLGIGNGIFIPMGVDLVVDFYEGKERGTMLGFLSAFIGISGLAFSSLGGYLAGIQWNYVYFAYLVSAVFLAVPLIFLPEPDRQAKVAAEKAANVDTKLNPGVFVMAMGFCVFTFAWYIMPTNTAIVVLGEGIPPAQIGLLFGIMSIAFAVVGAVYGPLVRTLTATVLFPLTFVLNAAGLYIIYSGHSFAQFAAGIALTGMAFGLAIPTFMGKITSLVSYTAVAKAIAVAYFFNGIGGFVQPIVSSWLGANGIGRPIFFTGMMISVIMIFLIIVADKLFPTPPPSQDPPQALAS